MGSSYKNQKLKRIQMDRSVKKTRHSMQNVPSLEIWLNEIREALGMSKAQLAYRMDMPRQGMYQLEKSLEQDSISISSLKKIAQALECHLFITLIPNESLEMIVKKQARSVAKRIVEQISHTMALEKQEPSKEYIKNQIRELTEDLIRTSDKKIWSRK